MISAAWLERHQPEWERLDALARQTQRRGPRRMSAQELRELAVLYRQATADLARLRTEPHADLYAAPLNALLARTHALVYAARPARKLDLWRFYRDTYPRIFHACRYYVALAAAIFALAALAGAIAARHNPEFIARLLPPGVRNALHKHQMWTTSVLAVSPEASSGIMTNNLTVAFSAYALGLSAGLGTLYILFFNGMLMGVVSVACMRAGLGLSLWSFVAPHGVLELPAIFIAGGAGLRLAAGLLFPGRDTRARSLARAGAEGTRLLLGVLPMLFMAGIIEAFISARPWPVQLKFVLAAAEALALTVYLRGLWQSDPRCINS